jgi:hypothetical protein
MKKITSLVAVFCLTVAIALGQESSKIFEITYLKPRQDKMAELTKGLGDHNKKYHASGPYRVSIWANYTGSHVNDLAWVMGPFTYAELDNRPESKEHDEDYQANVAPYVEVTASEYWRLDEKISYVPENYKYGNKVIWTTFDLRPFEGYRFKEMCKKIAEVYKAKNYTYNFEVYWSEFESRAGRDVAVETGFEKWAFFDREETFKKDYEEIHGEGSHRLLLEEYRDIIISAEDEVSERIPEMSGW